MDKTPFENEQHYWLEGRYVKKSTYYEDKERSEKDLDTRLDSIEKSMLKTEQTFKIISRIFTIILAPIILILVNVLIENLS